ncbi:hypothetical protein Lser_V15G03740 [Lactuca serriola]
MLLFPYFIMLNPPKSGGKKVALERMEEETDANKRSKLAEKMDRWNKALTEIANLKGKHINDREEADFIEEIVKDIYRRLLISSRFPLPQLTGMGNSVNFITSWLKDASSHTTDILTILGMGGMGKTTLAKYIYVLNSHEFDTSSFIEDISRRCDGKYNGLLDVQKQLYDDISKPSSVQVQVHDVSIYTSMIENVVSHKEKVLLVLDDISSPDQLDALLGSKGFCTGSKIIITTKDAWLTRCSLFKMNINPKYEHHKLECLSKIESRSFFCFHAFVGNNPEPDYEQVLEKLVDYCGGHPMALKVLGRSLHKQKVAYWEGYLDRLKKENDSPINNILRMSFDSLPSENDKDLFKHIACIFVGMDIDVTVTILEACDKETKSGITNLIDKCLLSIGWNKELVMHQLVQEMGRFVVREESLYKPWKRSRIWDHDSLSVLKQKKGTENVLGLTLDMRMLEKKKLCGSVELNTDALSKMDRLMLLQLNYVQITGSYNKFPEELRWLCMHGSSLKSIPSNLPMENLVALDMSYSNIESFGNFYSNTKRLHKWLKLTGSCFEGKRLPPSLKILNLSFCEQLLSLGGFGQLPALEKLILKGCVGLLEICESIEQCFELVLVDLSYCNKLKKLSRITGMLNKVKTLLLDGCNLGESRIEIKDMNSAELLKANNTDLNTKAASRAVLEVIPSDSKFFVISLPSTLVTLSLADNNLSNESFPVDFRCLAMLRELFLDKNPVVSLPHCVKNLPRLQMLSMQDCKMLTSVEHPPQTLTYLNLYSKYKPLLRKVVFDTKMSPLDIFIELKTLLPSLFEFEGLVKIQPMAGVEEMVLHGLGWTKLDILHERGILTSSCDRTYVESEIQMYYEFGIFSTIYGGKEMPNWITDRNPGPSTSFTIPSSLNKLRGLNFCYVQMSLDVEFKYLPMIIISNKTKSCTWIYDHCIDGVIDVGEQCFTFLSHWMFGMNDMEVGDHITITVRENRFHVCKQDTQMCGVSFIYDDGATDEEEDVLSYYKSWNHIIGGDLTGFQLTTGEYILNKSRILLRDVDSVLQPYQYLCGEDASFKDKRVHFRAFSETESGMPEDGIQGTFISQN